MRRRDLLLLLGAAAPLAAPLAAQHGAKSISGTVLGFKPSSLELMVQPDHGRSVDVKFSSETEMLQVPPGVHDLKQARPVKVTDIDTGDRVLVSFVSGLTEARRIVLISAVDITARNEAVKKDWQDRGTFGTVASLEAGRVVLQKRTPKGAESLTVAITPSTVIRRYAPGSVRFADAMLSNPSEISVGDQLRCRGAKSEDGKGVTAEEIVFGTFLTKAGPILSVNRDAGEVRIQDLATNQPLTVKVTENSQLKAMPDMRTMFASMMRAGKKGQDEHMPSVAGFDFARMIAQLPVATMDDLKTGSNVIVTSTRGERPGEVTAIMVLANADAIIEMAQMETGDSPQSAGMSITDALSHIHGGVFNGPSGLAVPAIIP